MTRRQRERELRLYPMALTVPEVAEILRVCTKTVYKIIKENNIPAVKVGREIRVSKVRLIDYLQNSAYGHLDKTSKEISANVINNVLNKNV